MHGGVIWSLRASRLAELSAEADIRTALEAQGGKPETQTRTLSCHHHHHRRLDRLLGAAGLKQLLATGAAAGWYKVKTGGGEIIKYSYKIALGIYEPKAN